MTGSSDECSSPGAGVLSDPSGPFERIPVEILQVIMYSSVFSIPQSQDDPSRECDENALISMSRVSRSWRSVALGTYALWALLPKIALHSVPKDREESLFERLQLRLLRSGSFPLTFSLEIRRFVFEERPTFATKVLSALTEHCPRWKEAAILRMPPAVFPEFNSATHGKLLLLSRFELTFDRDRWLWDLPPDDTPEPIILDLSYAPLLTSVKVDTENEMVCAFVPQLPLVQLEHFSASLYHPSTYSDLIGASPPNLQSLRCHLRTLSPSLPTTTSTLPRLQVLHLTTYGADDLSLHRILDHLVTPSLEEIAVACLDFQGEHTLDAPIHMRLGEGILSLIRRSSCRVRRLDLVSVRIPTSSTLYRDFTSLLSPHLTHLMIYSDSLEELSRLVVHPPSSHSRDIFLPSLKILAIYNVAEPGHVDPNAAASLLDIIGSRTLRQDRGTSLTGAVQPLKEVHFGPFNPSKMQRILGLWESRNATDTSASPTFRKIPNPEHAEQLDSLAMRATTAFFSSTIYDKSSKICNEACTILDDIEAVQVSTCSTLPLIRRNFPWMMRQWCIRLKQDRFEDPLWPIIESIGDRTKSILERWKPHFIEDVRTYPYRWELGNLPLMGDFGQMRCLCNTSVTEDDDTLWEYLMEHQWVHSYSLL